MALVKYPNGHEYDTKETSMNDILKKIGINVEETDKGAKVSFDRGEYAQAGLVPIMDRMEQHVGSMGRQHGVSIESNRIQNGSEVAFEIAGAKPETLEGMVVNGLTHNSDSRAGSKFKTEVRKASGEKVLTDNFDQNAKGQKSVASSLEKTKPVFRKGEIAFNIR